MVIQYLDIEPTKKFLHKKTKSSVQHIIPFNVTNNFNILKIENIISIEHVMQIGNNICKIVNTYNTVI